MKKIWMPVVAMALVLGSCATEVKKEETKSDEKEVVKEEEKKDEVVEMMADTQASAINFVGSKVGEDDPHAGTVKLSEGKFTLTNGVMTAGSFTIDMTSATTGIEDLDKHITQPDMFDVVNFPTATFTVTEGSETEVKGTLSTIGAEIPVVLTVESTGDNTWTGKGFADYAGTNASTLQHEEGATKYIDSKIALEITLVGKK